MTDHLLQVAVAGLGAWGSNVFRAFQQVPRCRIVAACDLQPRRLLAMAEPELFLTRDFDMLLRPSVQAVVIATPSDTHAELALSALAAKKHVLVEKPMALSKSSASALCRAAAEHDRQLMVGHILRYHPALRTLQRLCASNALGEIRYAFAERLGATPRPDLDVWWNLAPHDLSLLRWLLGTEAETVSVCAEDTRSRRSRTAREAAISRISFGGGARALLHFNNVGDGPNGKVRRLTLVGTRRVAIFDDRQRTNKLTLYRYAPELLSALARLETAVQASHAALPSDVRLIRDFHGALDPATAIGVLTESTPPLELEARHFVTSVLSEAPVDTGGDEGLQVVALLEAGTQSLSTGTVMRPFVKGPVAASEARASL